MGKTVRILGTEYRIVTKRFDDDEFFSRESAGGYCDSYLKEIVVCDMTTCKGWEHEPRKTIENSQKQTVRHEIVHAFLHESGLMENSYRADCGWSRNEEMVDWIAWQGEKIYRAWGEAGAL